MFLFPIIYVFFFGIAVYHIARSNTGAALLFVIFGLPIYITSLSVTFLYGFGNMVPILQSFKEIVVLLAFLTVVLSIKKKPVFHLLDKMIIAYFGYIFLYAMLPFGGYSLTEKLIALKNIAFFPLIYFTGRFIDPQQINLNRIFQYICVVALPAAIIVIWEGITYTHFQTFTGYADYMFYFFGQEPSGHYGLSWTFEAENDGLKRFASFFANPLDHASGTLAAVSAILALATTDTNKVKLNRFLLIAFLCTLTCIILALSRASFVSYFIILYIYSIVTRKTLWLRYFHYGAAVCIIIVFSFMNGDIYQFIINTINFSNSSSAYHVLAWLEGIQAIATNPLGLGLGTSGRISAMLGTNIGGENQLIIIAVQAGLVALSLFIFIYVYLMRTAIVMIKQYKGKTRKVALFVLLVKTGMIIPFLTAEAETYLYISYLTWFFSGYMINIKYQADDYRRRYTGPEVGENRTENNPGGDLQTIQVTGG